MLLTIQIVNYKSQNNLANCLDSMRENIPEGSTSQMIIVNNDEKAISPGECQGFPFDIEIIEAGGNLGFSRAHNLGAKKALGEYILFLNPDTEILPQSLTKLIETFKSNEKIGIAGPAMLGESGFQEEEHFGFRKNPLSLIGTKVYRFKPDTKQPMEVDWISGGAMMIKKDLFRELGGFDENFFMYFEDVDLCLRAKQKGYKIIFNPGARIIHKSGQSFSDNRKKKKYYYSSQDYYIRKNFGPAWVWVVKALRFPYYIKNVWLR